MTEVKKWRKLPDEPERLAERVGRARYAVKFANTDADFLAAARLFEEATNAASWNPIYYYNAGLAYEDARRPADALRVYRWCRRVKPEGYDVKVSRDVRERIAGLESVLNRR